MATKLEQTKQKLGVIADMFGGLTGKAADALRGTIRDPKTNAIKKSKRQQILDEI